MQSVEHKTLDGAERSKVTRVMRGYEGQREVTMSNQGNGVMMLDKNEGEGCSREDPTRYVHSDDGPTSHNPQPHITKKPGRHT